MKVDRTLALVALLWLATSVLLLFSYRDSHAQASHPQPQSVETAQLHHAAARALRM